MRQHERPDTDRLTASIVKATSHEGEIDTDRVASVREVVVLAQNGHGKPPGKFLGLDAGAWTKLGLAAAVFLVTWYFTVNEDLKERPTRDEVNQQVDDQLGNHSDVPHPPTEKRLKVLEGETRTIRESQIRQETIDTTQTGALERIEKKLDRPQRRRR